MSNDLKCIELSKEWEQKYEEFVRSHPGSMFYHTLSYRDLLKQVIDVKENYLLVIDEEQNIQAVLPIMFKTGILGVVANSLPFYGSNGGILEKNTKAFELLINYYNDHIANNENIAASTIVTNPLLDQDAYKTLDHQIKDSRIGQFTSLDFQSDHEKQLMNSFHYKTRNMVRKAQKQGLDILVDNTQIEFLYETHKQNMRAIGGKPKTQKFFSEFPKLYKANTDYKIYVAKENNDLIAAVLLFYYNNTVEYYTPVIIEEHREKQPLSLLIFEAMKEASKEGYKLWNWGGTWLTQDGVYRFKSRWGTKDINYYYYTKINTEKIYHCSKEQLLSEYNDVFVIPFSHLKVLDNE